MAIFTHLKNLLTFESSGTHADAAEDNVVSRPQLRRHPPIATEAAPPATQKDIFLHAAYKETLAHIADRRIKPVRISRVHDADIGKRYYVSNSLMNGSSGKMRLAMDSQTDKVWAIKEFRLPPTEYAGKKNQPKDKKRKIAETPFYYIKSEYDVGQKIQSPVRMQRLLFDDGRIYAMMKFMDGGDMIDFVDRFNDALFEKTRRMPADRSATGLFFLGQLSRELSRIHEKNIVHCDVKPDNVFYNRKAEVYLGDLGGCNEADALGRVQTRVGTHGYFSPERVASTRPYFGAAADVWAMGVSIAEMWCTKSWYAETKYMLSGTPFDVESFAQEKQNLYIFELFRGQKLGISTTEDNASEPLNGEGKQRFDAFGKLFALIDKDDATLSDYLLKHVLDPNPETRPTAKDVLKFVDTNIDKRQEQTAKRYLNQFSNGPSSKTEITLANMKRVAREDKLNEYMAILDI